MTSWLTWLALVLGIDPGNDTASMELPQLPVLDTGAEPPPAGPPK